MSLDQYISGACAAIRTLDGQTIRYKRDEHYVHFSAVKGRTSFDVTDADGVTVEFVSTDFLFSACSLVLNGARVEPEDNDLIECGGKTYEVLRPGGGQSWRYSDTGETHIRVHTKQREG